MDAQARLARILAGVSGVRPPAFESEFAEDTIAAWRAAGRLDARPPGEFFGLDRREEIEITWWRIPEEKPPLESEAALTAFRNAYDPETPGRFPDAWPQIAARARQREHIVEIAPWNEGLFQIIGVENGDSLARALGALCERPALAEAAMEHYADFLEAVLERFLRDITPDYALFYEPIASNHGPVIAPAMYARFAAAALGRVAACLERHGVSHRLVWSAGAVRGFIPIWLDAGLNGLYLNQAGQAGVRYRDLRREFGGRLTLFGGIDWRAVIAGPAAIDGFLETEVRPLLAMGGYVPYLDDTIRAYMPFEHFAHYRRRLDWLLDEVFGAR